MSTYTDYDAISRTYDKTRKAVGIEIILGFLASLDKPLNELTVLDAGCGTGNYSVKLKEKVGHVTCADVSVGMLEQASKKLENSTKGGSYELIQCDISRFPAITQKFDAIVCNQSLHHLDNPGENFPNLRRFLAQADKLLNPGGILLINTITHEQLQHGVWWGELIKPAVDRMVHRFTTVDKLYELLAKANFKVIHRVVPVDTLIQEQGYFDPASLQSETFRNGDSHFSLLTPEELDSILSKLNKLISDGLISLYIQERDKLRLQYGQFTFFVAQTLTCQ